MCESSEVVDTTFWPVQPKNEFVANKITVVGAGSVGMAVAICLLSKNISKNLVLFDALGDKVKGEVLDLQHGSLYLGHPTIDGGNGYEITANSRLIILTAGVRQEQGESRLNLAQRNADILIRLVPLLIKYSPNAILLVVGNPCDVLTWVAWRISGLPAHKVIGAGTVLDTARFRFYLSEKFQIHPHNVHAWIIGEHGDSSIPLWSGVNVAGVRLQSYNPDAGKDNDTEDWAQVHKQVVSAAGDIIDLKGYTNWGIACSISAIVGCLQHNSLKVFPVSINLNGKYGVTDDVFVPMPAVVGWNGVTDVLNLHLDKKELDALLVTVRVLKGVQDSISLVKKEIKCKCKRCAQ